jgi:23S rRNA (guanosine2251-2'-O)-methyltransferase
MAKITNEALGRLSVEDFKNTKKNPLALILDDVRSLHNVGSVFRTCDAFLVEKLYLCGITGQPPDREIHKTALGATESVDWAYEKNVLDLVEKLQSEGWQIIAVEQADNAVLLQDFVFENNRKYALVFGNEVFGVKEEIVSQADSVIEIPQFGTKHSLNLSVSAGVVLWEAIKPPPTSPLTG